MSKIIPPAGVRFDDTQAQLPKILMAQEDDQIVYLQKPGAELVLDGKHFTGRVIDTKGGIKYVVGERDSSFTKERPERLKELLRLEELARKGVIIATTPEDLYLNGVDGDRSALAIFHTSGGEGSAIGVNLATVAGLLSDTHVVLGSWQGFGSGIKKTDEFAKMLTVLNAPQVRERMSHTGGSPLGMSRVKLKEGSKEENQFMENHEGVGIIYGTGGGDHSRNFKRVADIIRENPEKYDNIIVGVTPKSMDNDLAIQLADGSAVNSLMVGFLSTVNVMRRHWFDEFQSAAGAGRVVVGFFFGRGAGWTVLGATRCDEAYKQRIREEGILTPDLENKMDALGSRQVPLIPEEPITIKQLFEAVEKARNRGRDRTAGVACSEGAMIVEVDEEARRLGDILNTKEAEGGNAAQRWKDEALRKARNGDFKDLIANNDLRKAFTGRPEVGLEFINDAVINPKKDDWGHSYVKMIPKIVDALLNEVAGIKTNYVEIKYEARTGETTPSDRDVGEVTGETAGQKLKEGKSGLTTVTYLPGEDPLLINPRQRGATFIPFETIAGMTEHDNNLKQLSREYLKSLGIIFT
jgi:6-phosphofructokinase